MSDTRQDDFDIDANLKSIDEEREVSIARLKKALEQQNQQETKNTIQSYNNDMENAHKDAKAKISNAEAMYDNISPNQNLASLTVGELTAFKKRLDIQTESLDQSTMSAITPQLAARFIQEQRKLGDDFIRHEHVGSQEQRAEFSANQEALTSLKDKLKNYKQIEQQKQNILAKLTALNNNVKVTINGKVRAQKAQMTKTTESGGIDKAKAKESTLRRLWNRFKSLIGVASKSRNNAILGLTETLKEISQMEATGSRHNMYNLQKKVEDRLKNVTHTLSNEKQNTQEKASDEVSLKEKYSKMHQQKIQQIREKYSAKLPVIKELDSKSRSSTAKNDKNLSHAKKTLLDKNDSPSQSR